ncbi:MAG: GNAT family N-acetyltransferase [Acidimicrobiales bacterium]
MDPTTIIRQAVLGDGAAMGLVHVRAWQAAYQLIMSPEQLESLDPEEFGHNWEEALQTNPHPEQSRRLVAVTADKIVGIALVRADESDMASTQGQLVLINLLPEAWGTGVGAKLLTACRESLSELGFDEGFLWVATGNDRARRFYEREGWRADGAKQIEQLGGTTVEEVRYRFG